MEVGINFIPGLVDPKLQAVMIYFTHETSDAKSTVRAAAKLLAHRINFTPGIAATLKDSHDYFHT